MNKDNKIKADQKKDDIEKSKTIKKVLIQRKRKQKKIF